jgi:hypothetical protein
MDIGKNRPMTVWQVVLKVIATDMAHFGVRKKCDTLCFNNCNAILWYFLVMHMRLLIGKNKETTKIENLRQGRR